MFLLPGLGRSPFFLIKASKSANLNGHAAPGCSVDFTRHVTDILTLDGGKGQQVAMKAAEIDEPDVPDQK